MRKQELVSATRYGMYFSKDGFLPLRETKRLRDWTRGTAHKCIWLKLEIPRHQMLELSIGQAAEARKKASLVKKSKPAELQSCPCAVGAAGEPKP